MLIRKLKPEKTGLEKAIDDILLTLNGLTPETKEYAAAADQLVKLYALKDYDRPQRVSPDTKAIIAGNILVTTIVVAYEQKAVITSKAKDFWLKLR